MKLSSENVDRLSTPMEWSDENFKKSLAVRTKATFSQKPFTTTTNAWMWLNLLIDNISDSTDSNKLVAKSECLFIIHVYFQYLCTFLFHSNSFLIFSDRKRKDDLLAEVSNLSALRHNESTLSDWIMYFLGKVQADLSQDTNAIGSLFSLDLFMFFIVIAAGCDAYIKEELSLNNRIQWLNKFPDALYLLSKRSSWNYHMARVRIWT